MPFNWPWKRSEEQGGDELAEWDEQGEEGQLYEDEGGEEQEDEPELDPEVAAIVEREAQKRVAAAEARYQEALKAQGLAWTGGRVAIEKMDTFATEMGFGPPPAQQQQAQQPAPRQEEAPVDPFAALGPRPDPSYDAEGFDQWQTRRDQVLIKLAQDAMAPQFQSMQQQINESKVTAAVANAREALRDTPLQTLADDPSFGAAMAQSLLTIDPGLWEDPSTLFGTAAVLNKRGVLKLAAPQQPARPRNDQGQFTQQQRSLAQVSASRDSGRVPPPNAGSDPEDRRLAAMLGISVEEWNSLGQNDPAVRQRFRERRKAKP